MREILLPLPGRDQSYRLLIQPGLRLELGHLLKPLKLPPRLFLIADSRVAHLHGAAVKKALEDAGFCKKGEGGPFFEKNDFTYKGNLPINTHGGQLSWGQPVGSGAGGISHVIDATEQLMGRAGERQVRNCELAFVNGNGGTMSKECSLVLGRQP